MGTSSPQLAGQQTRASAEAVQFWQRQGARARHVQDLLYICFRYAYANACALNLLPLALTLLLLSCLGCFLPDAAVLMQLLYTTYICKPLNSTPLLQTVLRACAAVWSNRMHSCHRCLVSRLCHVRARWGQTISPQLYMYYKAAPTTQSCKFQPHTLSCFGSATCPPCPCLYSCVWLCCTRMAEESIKVLGTPTRKEIDSIKSNHTESESPKITAHPWSKVFLLMNCTARPYSFAGNKASCATYFTQQVSL